MELSRRDALGALGVAGITSTAGCTDLFASDETDEPEDSEPIETLVGLAEVLYPSDIEPTAEFIETYLFGRITDEAAYEEELAHGVEAIDALADEQFETTFLDLDTDERVELFEETELRSGDSVAAGSSIERINYHLVDELLFAFYSSPTGGELVGNANPRGYPGGYGHSSPVEQ